MSPRAIECNPGFAKKYDRILKFIGHLQWSVRFIKYLYYPAAAESSPK